MVVMSMSCGNKIRYHPLPQSRIKQMKTTETVLSLGFSFTNCRIFMGKDMLAISPFYHICSCKHSSEPLSSSKPIEKKIIKKGGKKEHHLWKKRDSAGSGQKALSLVRLISDLPNEKGAVYGALDKWTAWEAEFPLVAASKALRILKRSSQWIRLIQVAKWMLSKGQGTTMGTYDTLLLAFDMDKRVDEAESLWNMILHTQTRSVSKRLFSRMISLYDHHNMQNKIIEVFADMEELGVKPDEDTVKRVARAFHELGQEEKKKLLLKKYQRKWKYIYFNGPELPVLELITRRNVKSLQQCYVHHDLLNEHAYEVYPFCELLFGLCTSELYTTSDF
ncbi:hypothetical protein FNV43_RR05904 [Rhamnella rubrinervis]|uniref:Pentatricopeptide repeat-containing protein n=1 Tax=Rhamnella rubrinervis TaxID=2594499 RepID=A0A8K0MLG0_9ROSA|nr:hypothetical protein FNV43_RR05904 [Rhamnella rubrinervis]